MDSNKDKEMKTLLISAACSDMAMATIELLRGHYRFVLIARDEHRLNETIARMKWASSVEVALACDVRSKDMCASLAVRLADRDLALDGVVNFAGSLPERANFLQLDVDRLLDDFMTRVVGNINLLRHLAPQLKQGASVVMINGILSKMPDADFLCGSLSTAALRSLGKAAARTLAARRIRVNTVNPCAAETKMKDRVFDALSAQVGIAPSAIQAAVESKIPLERLCAPLDVAKTVKFLLSDESSFITGASIDVDGGYNASLA
jgi:NAD(P)-dependent dehydrogenase (short-subunit alcohol dehydrogenase family)